jgi:hypothetical protein
LTWNHPIVLRSFQRVGSRRTRRSSRRRIAPHKGRRHFCEAWNGWPPVSCGPDPG